MAETCTWTGKSGTKYDYEITAVGASIKSVDGNYIYAKRTSSGWVPVYIGQGDLKSGRTSTSTTRARA